MTHHLHLEFESTRELLDFAAKHLHNSPTQVAATASTMPPEGRVFTESNAETTAPVAEDAPVAKPAKKTKVKVEEPAADLDTDTPAGMSAANAAADEAQVKTEAKPAAKAAPAAEEPEEGEELDYKKHVRPTAILLIKTAGGQETMRGIFDDFGVTNAAELTPKQLPAYLKAVQDALAEAKLAEQE